MLVAAANADDVRHARARRLLADIVAGEHGAPCTSDFVLAETFNFVRQRIGRKAAAEEVKAVVFGRPAARPLVEGVLRVSAPCLAASLERYLKKWPAGLSLTDWTSVVLMEERGIEAIATFDRGFEAWVQVVR